jgi:diguanylate cyclase (GGDEF)-like protein
MIGEEGDCIIIQNQADMEHIKNVNNPWYQTLVEAGVKSVVLFPLIQGTDLLGFIWATNFDTENTLRIKETLELTTFFISSHIARYKAMENLERMSYTDMMTGLPNNIACRDNISNYIRNQRKFAVVSIDLNHFKSINHTLGIEAGNQAITGIADRWKKVREGQSSDVSEFIARVSGDEFMLIICGYRTTEELIKVITKYSDALSEPFIIEGCDIYISASFGFTEYPAHGGTVDTLVSRANTAMSAIKKAASSDNILRYSSEISQNERMLELENKIRTAL